MKFSKTLAMILAFALLLSVSAYAAGADETGKENASETDAALTGTAGTALEDSPTDIGPAEDADDERVPTDHIVLDRDAGRVVLEGLTVGGADVLIESVPAGGEAQGSLEVSLIDAAAKGDVLHGDGQRAMELSLAGTRLEGAVTGPAQTGAAPDAVEEMEAKTGSETAQEAEAAVPAAKDETKQEDETPPAGEAAAAGVHMTLDSASTWIVTGPSALAGLSLEEGAQVQAAEGESLAVYVNCAVDEKTGTYDADTGSYISTLVPGVQYEGVALVVSGEQEQPEAGTDLFAAMGVDTDLVDGDYSVALESFLDAMGIQAVYDEQSGSLTITNADQVLDALSGAEE